MVLVTLCESKQTKSHKQKAGREWGGWLLIVVGGPPPFVLCFPTSHMNKVGNIHFLFQNDIQEVEQRLRGAQGPHPHPTV